MKFTVTKRSQNNLKKKNEKFKRKSSKKRRNNRNGKKKQKQEKFVTERKLVKFNTDGERSYPTLKRQERSYHTLEAMSLSSRTDSTAFIGEESSSQEL